MTEQTDEAAKRLTPFVPPETDQERQDHSRHAIRRLGLARDAMKLALRAASNASYEAGTRPTPAEILAEWHGANQLLQTVFRHLSFEVSNATETIRQMQSSR
jgi:hypothetical protein